MIRLTKQEVLFLHGLMARETGGSAGVREEGLLESALAGAFMCFGGQELYPTLEEKAARLGYTLIANHAFVDGNKRIGLFVMLIFLELNGRRVTCSSDDLVSLGLGAADGSVDYEALLAWVRRNTA